MTHTKALVSLVGLTVATGAAMAQAFSTGAGFSAPGGTVDPNWTVARTVGLTTFGAISAVQLNHGLSDYPYQAYVANDANSQWISYQANGGRNPTGGSNPLEVYVYSTIVNFGSGSVLKGYLWSDNAVLDVKVGATSLGTAPLATTYSDDDVAWFQTGTAFNVGYYTGIKTVSFTIQNGVPGSPFTEDPSAFRARLTPVPEPFTLGLGVAAIAVGLRRRIKR